MKPSAIETVIRPVTHDLGAFKVRRSLPSRGRTMVGPFIFVDQFGPARLAPGEGMDVRPHPHINLATVTYLFDGAIDHRDSLGSCQRIERGAINLMTAGRGIVHSERSPGDQRAAGPGFYGMQTWLALPDGKEEVEPAFEHVADSELPTVDGKGIRATVLMGELFGVRAATTCHSPTIYADLILDSRASLAIDSTADERAILLTEGEATLDEVPVALFDLIVIAPGHRPILRASRPSRVMLLGGGTFQTPRHVFWNFVSSSRERIDQAKADWRAGNFPPIPGDDKEFIPIPDVPKTVSYL